LWGGGGVAFSPNGESLFFTSQFIFWQTDLSQNPAVPDTALMLDYDWGTVPHLMQYGANGRIYLNSINRATYFSAVRNPQAMPGEDVNFTFADVSLPVFNVRTLPHFPNFRLYDLSNSPCDTLGIDVAVKEPNNYNNIGMTLTPNPAYESLTVSFDKATTSGQISIAEITGKTWLTGARSAGQTTFEASVRHLPAGVYIVSFRSDAGQYVAQKLVVQHR
jgi:hypothetical protein